MRTRPLARDHLMRMCDFACHHVLDYINCVDRSNPFTSAASCCLSWQDGLCVQILCCNIRAHWC